MKLWLCYRKEKINEEEKKITAWDFFRDKPLSLHDLATFGDVTHKDFIYFASPNVAKARSHSPS
jgi:hypothetical protein